MQYQQPSDLQNGSIASAQPGGNSPNSPPGSYGMVPGTKRALINGGRFDFEDGGTYCGGWEEGKAHGFGVCTGPKHQGAYAGAWNYGFEVSGVYIWPSGSSFEGQWQNGRRHGLGVEQRGRLVYRGEWTSGYKGRYGVRQSTTSTAKYEGTWANGLQDGYGSETYADGGSYQGQWQEGKRHGYGVRTSAPYGLASHYRPKPAVHTSMSSLNNENADPSDKRNHRMEDIRGGFVLRAKSDDEPTRRNSLGEKSKKGLFSGLKMRKQRSVGDLEKRGTAASGSIRSTVSTASWISTGSSQSVLSQKSIHSESNASFTLDDEQLDPSVVETYIGEWKRDKRDGYGISERSDGLKYEGEWHNNKKHGYGVTTFRDGTKEEGKYKNNILITSNKKKHLFLIRSRKFRERIEASIQAAQRALKYALQKADIAISRTTTARSKAEFADEAADKARVDCEGAVSTAREFAPDFKPSVLERFERLRYRERIRAQPSDDPVLPTIKHGQLQKSSLGNQNLGNTLDASALNRKPSMIPPSTFDNPQVPSSMYSQQISPRTDLTQHISKVQQYEHQRQQQHRSHQMNPSSTYQNQLQQSPSQLTQPLQTSLAVNETTDNYIGGSSLHLNQQLKQLPQQPNINQSLDNNFVNRNQTYLDYGNLPEQNYTNPSQQKQQQLNMDQIQIHNSLPGAGAGTSIRRNSRPVNQSVKPMLGEMGQQSSIDHFDHYKRPPSRDNSVDRYTRAASRLSGQSRQPSVDRNISVVPALNNTTSSDDTTPNRNVRASSQFRGATPAPQTSTGNGSIPTGNGSISASIGISQFSTRTGGHKAMYSSPNQPFEDVLLRQRTLGQDIIPSPSQPKRTESLFVPPKPISNVKVGGNSGIAGKVKLKSVPINVTLQRKKSLPDFQELPIATAMMSREEVSALGSARREEVRRQVELNERLKANPLLYLVSPQIKDWFSRQQLVLLVLIVNVVLAIMFFKMLT